MKPEELRKRKGIYERRAGKQITDEEFEGLMRRQDQIGRVVMAICSIAGLAMALEWPGRWVEPFGQISSYLGWAVVVICAASLIKGVLTR